MMKWAIDLQSCQTDSRDRGIGRYAMSLVTAMAERTRPGQHLVALLDASDPERLRDLRRRMRHSRAHVETATFSYPCVTDVTDQHETLVQAAGLLKSRLFMSTGADALLISSFFEVGGPFTTAYDWNVVGQAPKAVIAYDIIPALFPEKYLPEGHFVSKWYRRKLEAFKQFDLFLAISEATKNDLIECLGIDDRRIRVIGAGLDLGLLREDRRSASVQEKVISRLGITRPFVLTVGNADWRKNSLGALKAFASLPRAVRDRHQLVFTRVGDDVTQALAGEYADLAGQVVVAGTVDEATLSLLYKHCRVFFFPSLYEGFGLPVLEAMALGAPVLSSSLGALPEVVQNRQALFDPRDETAATAIMLRALEDESFRADLLKGANAHARSFTWEQCADAALDAMSEIAHGGRNTRRAAWRPSAEEIARLADAVEAAPFGDAALRASIQCVATGATRRILVDVSEVVRLDARSGIQRVVRNYCVGLIEAASQSGGFYVEPIFWTEQGIFYAREFARTRLGIDVQGDDELVRVQRNDLIFMVDSSWWSPHRFDVLHSEIRSCGGEVVWMVYDLVPLLLPGLCDPAMPPVFVDWLSHVANTADGCVCISAATQAELERYFESSLPTGAYRPWTRALHLGCDIESEQRGLRQTSSNLDDLMRQIGEWPYFVGLGTVEPRKDYPTILDAFERLWCEGSQAALVIIGKQGWNVEKFSAYLRSHEQLGKRLFWLENASDADLHAILTRATALVQASIAEGYGLPVAEAGSLGVPLILSNLPVFREIAGEEAAYFSVGDAAGLAALITRGLRDADWQSPKAINTMSWSDSSRQLAQLLLR